MQRSEVSPAVIGQCKNDLHFGTQINPCLTGDRLLDQWMLILSILNLAFLSFL
jgi:hypothetical protein